MPGVADLTDGLAQGQAARDRIELQLARAYARVFRRYARVAVANLHRHAPLVAAAEPDWRMPDADEILPLEQLQLDLGEASKPKHVAAVEATVAPALERFDIAFDVRNPLIEHVILGLGTKITRISEDARQDVMSELNVAWEAGESIPQAATRIRAVLGGQAAGNRGAVIARTELIGAQNGGSLAAAKITDAATHKGWLATRDGRTRMTHAQASGQQRRLDDAFDVGGSPLQFPGDPQGPPDEVIQCRCTMLFEDSRDPVQEELPMARVPGTTTNPPSRQLAADPAVVDPLAEDAMGAAWESDLAFVDTPTGDGRQLAREGFSTRTLPLSLMGMTTTPGPWGGHEGAEVCGRIDSIDLPSGSLAVLGAGRFGTGTFAQDIERMVGTGELTGVSVDLAIMAVEWAVINDDGTINYDPDPDEVEAAWWTDQLLMIAVEWQVMGATVCPFPAFEEAKIALLAAGGRVLHMAFSASGSHARVWSPIRLVEPITASAVGLAREEPPAEWFTTPEPADVCPFTVTDEGRVFGHIAAWQDCHIAYADGCVAPPRSPSGYAYFHTGQVVCEDGNRVDVGRITVGTGHPDLGQDRQATLRHYDDTGTVAAYVTAQDGEHGIWVCGAIEPSLDARRLRELRASAPSGDWRAVNGRLEMVGVLNVPVQGFPRARVRVNVAASGRPPVALIAAGALRVPTQRDVPGDVKAAAAAMLGPRRIAASLARRARS